jgi:hypothetical protein
MQGEMHLSLPLFPQLTYSAFYINHLQCVKDIHIIILSYMQLICNQ